MQVGIRSAEPAKPVDADMRSEVRGKPQPPDSAFDAALLRAQPRRLRADDELDTEHKPDDSGERTTWQVGLQPLTSLHSEPMPLRATTGNAQLDKQNAQHALSQLQQVQTLVPKHAVPATVGPVTNLRADLAVPQNPTVQLQVQTQLSPNAVPPTVAPVTNLRAELSIPQNTTVHVQQVQVLRADLAMPQNMTLHLQQAAPGQWSMRFKTDVHTQQLVAPHLHALRDRLKGRQVRIDGFAADDDDDLS